MTVSRRDFLAGTLATVALATNAVAQRDSRSLGERYGEVLIFGFKGTNPGDADYSSVEHSKPKVAEGVAVMVSHFMLELPARAGVNMMGTAGTVGFETTPADSPFYPGGVRCKANDR